MFTIHSEGIEAGARAMENMVGYFEKQLKEQMVVEATERFKRELVAKLAAVRFTSRTMFDEKTGRHTVQFVVATDGGQGA